MKYRNIQNAFSLMEMMVVLLIVSIIAAATAPMVTKKIARSAGSGDSPWVFTGISNNIAYNMNGSDNTTAIIGATSLPRDWTKHTRLFIDSGNNASHIAFGNGNAEPLLLTADPTRGRIGFSNEEIPNNSVAFGTGQTIDDGVESSVLIGSGTSATGSRAIVVGTKSSVGDYNARAGMDAIVIGQGAVAGTRGIAIGATTTNSLGTSVRTSVSTLCTDGIAIGSGAYVAGTSAIAMGNKAEVRSANSIAIGNGAESKYTNSIAIGNGAESKYTNSIAIGNGVKTSATNQIVLGGSSDIDTVYIPGNLVVGRSVRLNVVAGSDTWLRSYNKNNRVVALGTDDYAGNDDNFWRVDTKGIPYGIFASYYSDRRLKNVGEKYTAGLDELKKLDFYHYTFKDDKENTPLVGVMAQDLQKVFPDAVTKGDDGYLRIRLEDMFYAVINAVKELDNKISQIVADVSGLSTKVDEQQKLIDEQAQKIETLEKQNIELMDEIKDIEKQIKK